jgi:CRISPR-associated protein Cas1
MKTLFLSGYGIDLHVDSGRLIVRDGRDNSKEPTTYEFKAKHDDIDLIVVYGHTGNVSLEAMKWLSKQNIVITVLNWDGRVLMNVLSPDTKRFNIRMAQYDAYRNEQRVPLARSFIEAKIEHSLLVLDWIKTRYPPVYEEKESSINDIRSYKSSLDKARTPGDVLGVEGMVAQNYWSVIRAIIDKKLDFEGRNIGRTGKAMGATDPVNALFNYGYAMLETQCWIAVNSNGLDPQVGFLHEYAPSKAPLVYDLQEPYRWLVDISVIGALERKEFSRKDFILTDNYNIRLRPDATKKLIELVNGQLSSRVSYKNRSWEWRSVIHQKAGELVECLDGKRTSVDFITPYPVITRDDSEELRSKILSIGYNDWMKAGNSKGSLHYLKKNAMSEKPFKVYGKMKEKLDRTLSL